MTQEDRFPVTLTWKIYFSTWDFIFSHLEKNISQLGHKRIVSL